MNELWKANVGGILLIPAVSALCYLALPEEIKHRTPAAPRRSDDWVDPDPRPEASRGKIELGKWLFRRNCSTCHGAEGVGGIANQNYIKDTFPVLRTLAERMKICDEEENKAIIAYLSEGVDLEKIDPAPCPKYNVFLAQYRAIRDVIRKGSKAGKKDPNGPNPQDMPTWGGQVSDHEIDSVIAYLLTLQVWEKDEGSAEPEESSKPLRRGERVPDTRLVNQDGKEFRLSDLRGSGLVVSFIYTNCDVASMCPMAADKLVEVQKAMRGEEVRFLLISFDPQRDTAEKMREFAARHSIDTSNFWLATGPAEEVGSLAKSLNNHYRQAKPGLYDHTIVVALVDRDGVLRDDFFGTGWKAEEMVAALRGVRK